MNDSGLVGRFERVRDLDRNFQDLSALAAGLPVIMCLRVCPSSSSITMKDCPSNWSISWMVQMLG